MSQTETVKLPTIQGEYLRLMRIFYRRNKDAVVSSDLFRLQGLDKYLPTRHRNGIGRFFALSVEWGFLVELGRVRSGFDSTHGRKVGQYQWTEKARSELT
jgi:hypothetical protein